MDPENNSLKEKEAVYLHNFDSTLIIGELQIIWHCDCDSWLW